MSNKAKWRNYSKEEIEQFVKDSYSYRELAKKFGYAQDGGRNDVLIKENGGRIKFRCFSF